MENCEDWGYRANPDIDDETYLATFLAAKLRGRFLVILPSLFDLKLPYDCGDSPGQEIQFGVPVSGMGLAILKVVPWDAWTSPGLMGPGL